MDPLLGVESKGISMAPMPKAAAYGSMLDKFRNFSGVTSQIEVPDDKDRRFSVLYYDQIKRLNALMTKIIPIHGRRSFPTIDVRLCDIVSIVRTKLVTGGILVREVRFSGSGAASVLEAVFSDSDNGVPYNDIDIIFIVDLPTEKSYEKVRAAVLDSLLELLPPGVSRQHA